MITAGRVMETIFRRALNAHRFLSSIKCSTANTQLRSDGRDSPEGTFKPVPSFVVASALLLPDANLRRSLLAPTIISRSRLGGSATRYSS
jgi:hypothetical protein